MTSTDYCLRDAYNAALNSIVNFCLPVKKQKVNDAKRVIQTPWGFGLYVDVGGLTKTEEKRIAETIRVAFPKFIVNAERKTKFHNRVLRVAF